MSPFTEEEWDAATAATGATAGSNGHTSLVHPSWEPVDLGPVLAGELEPIVPLIGDRADGTHMFYPGKTHSIVSESEAGKSWLALLTITTEAQLGYSSLYLDFEDTEEIHVDRLRTIGLADDMILEHFHYYRPEVPITQYALLGLYEAAIAANARMVWLDGITEAMSLHGLNPLDNKDIAAFNAKMATPFTRQGLAYTALDHVVKSGENRGRYGLGGVHKLNAVSGAQYVLEIVEPFGIARTGKTSIKIGKDRPGRLRQHGLAGKEGMVWFGNLVIESFDEHSAMFSITAPSTAGSSPTFRPTTLMTMFSTYIAEHPGLTKNALLGAIKGKQDYKILALELLVNEGFVRVERKGQKQLHHQIRSFEES